jgi:hypothetical protein
VSPEEGNKNLFMEEGVWLGEEEIDDLFFWGPAKTEKKKQGGVLGCGACVEDGAGFVPGRRFGILAFPPPFVCS